MFSRKRNSKKFFLKFNLSLIFVFLLYFISNNTIYSQSELKSNPTHLIPVGEVLQLDIEFDNVVVRNQLENSPLILGDELIEINGRSINNYNDFSEVLYSLDNTQKIDVNIVRGYQNLAVKVEKDALEKVNCNNTLSGFATLTYIDPKTKEFGAVGHPISIGYAKNLSIKNGYVFSTNGLNIQKSYRGKVGSLSARGKDEIGTFCDNTPFGIKGIISNFNTTNLKQYKVANLEDVKAGKAHIILKTNNDNYDKFDIEILSVEKQTKPKSKAFKIKITDKRLLNLTGGIVQGMSGTPIVQGDKIVGAISHAVESDPSTGYGVFIKWMLNN